MSGGYFSCGAEEIHVNVKEIKQAYIRRTQVLIYIYVYITNIYPATCMDYLSSHLQAVYK